MQRIAEIVENGHVVGIVHGPDAYDQQITVNGRVWRFDFDKWMGPFWLRKDGGDRKCQNPGKSVWKEWEKWHKRWLRRQKKSETVPTTSRGESCDAPA